MSPNLTPGKAYTNEELANLGLAYRQKMGDYYFYMESGKNDVGKHASYLFRSDAKGERRIFSTVVCPKTPPTKRT